MTFFPSPEGKYCINVGVDYFVTMLTPKGPGVFKLSSCSKLNFLISVG
jgi:hypothetical protein